MIPIAECLTSFFRGRKAPPPRSGRERRQYERVAVSMPAEVRFLTTDGWTGWSQVTIQDLSRGGFSAVVANGHPLESDLEIRSQRGTFEGTVVRVRETVIHCRFWTPLARLEDFMARKS